jgi:hypothetical protein
VTHVFTIMLIAVAGYALVSHRVRWKGKLTIFAFVGFLLVGPELLIAALS